MYTNAVFYIIPTQLFYTLNVKGMVDMRKIALVASIIASLGILGACSQGNSNDMKDMDHSSMKMEGMDHSSKDMKDIDHDKMDGHESHSNVVSLNNSTGENEIKIPAELKRNNKDEAVYTVRAQKGKTEIFDGVQTNTYGYNGSFLGPMIRLVKGETVKISTINELDEDTTFHWHGLEVPGEKDGGPQSILKPGEEKNPRI